MGDEFNLMDHSDLYILDFSKCPRLNQCLVCWLELFYLADADIFINPPRTTPGCHLKQGYDIFYIRLSGGCLLLTPLLHFSPSLACLALALLCVITWGTSVS